MFVMPMARTNSRNLPNDAVKRDRLSAEAYAYLVAIARADGRLKF